MIADDGWEYFRHDLPADADWRTTYHHLDFWARIRPERRGIFRRRDVWVWEVHNQLSRNVHPDRRGVAADRLGALAAIDECISRARWITHPRWWDAPSSGDTSWDTRSTP